MLVNKTILLPECDIDSLKSAMSEACYFDMLKPEDAMTGKLIPPGAISYSGERRENIGEDYKALKNDHFRFTSVTTERNEKFDAAQINLYFEVWNNPAWTLLEQSGLCEFTLIADSHQEFDGFRMITIIDKVHGFGYGVENMADAYYREFGGCGVFLIPENVFGVLSTGDVNKDLTGENICLINVPNKYTSVNHNVTPASVYTVAEMLHSSGVNDLSFINRLKLVEGLETLNHVLLKTNVGA